MESKIIITPLEKLDGLKIEKYIGFISATSVSEFPFDASVRVAMLSREKREGELEIFFRKLYHSVIEKIMRSAEQRGGNAILGFRVNIARVGRNVFVAYAYGTLAEVST